MPVLTLVHLQACARAPRPPQKKDTAVSVALCEADVRAKHGPPLHAAQLDASVANVRLDAGGDVWQLLRRCLAGREAHHPH